MKADRSKNKQFFVIPSQRCNLDQFKLCNWRARLRYNYSKKALETIKKFERVRKSLIHQTFVTIKVQIFLRKDIQPSKDRLYIYLYHNRASATAKKNILMTNTCTSTYTHTHTVYNRHLYKKNHMEIEKCASSIGRRIFGSKLQIIIFKMTYLFHLSSYISACFNGFLLLISRKKSSHKLLAK